MHPLGSVRLQTFSYSSYPDKSKERARLHKDVDAILLEDQAFQTLHARFRTKSDLGIDLLDAAISHIQGVKQKEAIFLNFELEADKNVCGKTELTQF